MSQEHTFDEGELIEGMQEALAHAKGRLTLKTTEIPRPSAKMSGYRIARIRRKFKASTPVFAAMLNVAPDTVRGWEKDRRQPSGPALRLLEIVSDRPELFLPGGFSVARRETGGGSKGIARDASGTIEKPRRVGYGLKNIRASRPRAFVG
jgi:putative transcriptional regulator